MGSSPETLATLVEGPIPCPRCRREGADVYTGVGVSVGNSRCLFGVSVLSA